MVFSFEGSVLNKSNVWT